jgi:DNA replication protein DnaC
LSLLERHKIQVLLDAEFSAAEVAKRTGFSLDTVRRVRRQSAVTHTDDKLEHRKRRVGRPSVAAEFSERVAQWLRREPELPTQELLRRANEAGHRAQDGVLRTWAGARPARAAPIVRFEGLPREFSQVARAEQEQWSYEQLLQTLFAEEVAHRRTTRLHRAVRAAHFLFLRTVKEFDFSYQSTLRLTTIGSLLSPGFVTEGGSVIFEGKPGRGKTHLAVAIAYRACRNGFDALFTTAADLIDELSTATQTGNFRDALNRFVKPHVLVVDEVGYVAYGNDAANVQYHVVGERHMRKRSMVYDEQAPEALGRSAAR